MVQIILNCHGISHEAEALKNYVESLTAKSHFVTADNPGLSYSNKSFYLHKKRWKYLFKRKP